MAPVRGRPPHAAKATYAATTVQAMEGQVPHQLDDARCCCWCWVVVVRRGEIGERESRVAGRQDQERIGDRGTLRFFAHGILDG